MNQDVKIDIRGAKYLIEWGTKPNFEEVFAYTNENLGGYMPKFDLEGKDVLTVTASGDHPLNAALLGAKNIDCFDTNRLTSYWAQLKKAGVATLKYDEFINFLFHDISVMDNKRGLRVKKYETIRKELESDTQTFWDEIIESGSFKPGFLAGKHDMLFSWGFELYKKRNLYFDRDGFVTLKKKLKKVNMNFIHANILDLPTATDKQYDAIFTSNICNYIPQGEYRLFCENKLATILKENGSAQVVYIYGNGNPQTRLNKDFDNFQDPRYSVIEFDSAHKNHPNEQGKIAVLHK